MAYGFSVFWLPLSKGHRHYRSVACPADMGFIARALSSTCDWKLNMLGWTYTLFFVFLGSAAASGEAGWSAPARAKRVRKPPSGWCGGS